ncbi:MAG TPA: right-handed parallel beta-helix repeat-containing protein [Patescibacteria group bacterium]|nr:right-handed parallel beta-helix repeat-containing protein [Patescibacteria group bacterium]
MSFLRKCLAGVFLILVLGVGSLAEAQTISSEPYLTGANYYVNGANGSDSNPGTSRELPWRTIQKAANTMVPGDKVTVLPGTYDQRVQINTSGSAGAPITYQAEGAVISKGFTVHTDYITIKGFEITNTDNDNQDGWGIYVDASNCVLEGNYVHFATRGGIRIWATPGNEPNIRNCVIRNNRLDRNSQAGIEVHGRNHLVEVNEIWDTIQYHPNWTNPPGWVDADGIRFHGSGHIFRKNYIHDIHYGIPENPNPHIDCFQTFSNSDHEAAQNIVFEQNICKNAQVSSTDSIGKGFMLEGASNILIRNNLIRAFSSLHINGSDRVTIVNNDLTSDLSIQTAYGPTGVNLDGTVNTIIKNNIFYDIIPNLTIHLLNDVSKQGLDVGYNCTYRSDGKPMSGSPYPHDLWGVNPRFVNAGSGDYRLQPFSPAIDVGIMLPEVSDDFEGNPRPQGTGFDIGAYESQVKIILLPNIIFEGHP